MKNSQTKQTMKSFLLKFLIPFLAFAVVASAMSHDVAGAVGVSPVVPFIGITALTYVVTVYSKPNSSGFTQMGIETEVWVTYIKEKLFKVNPFLAFATNHDDKVLGGKVVHLPQAGAPSAVVKNRNVFPAVAVRRTDTDINYSLDNYTTDPVHILFDELADITYDKIDSVIGQDMAALVEAVADDLIVKWLTSLPQTSIIRTTGDASALYNLPGATGNKLIFTEKDLRRAAAAIRKQNFREQLYAQLSVDMLEQLKDSLSQTQYNDFSRFYDAEKGVIGQLHGVTILEQRSQVAVFDENGGSPAVKAVGAAIAATDKDSGIIWGPSSVARAMGEAKLFEDTDDPHNYGDIYSTYLRYGGRRTRQDNAGILAIVPADEA